MLTRLTGSVALALALATAAAPAAARTIPVTTTADGGAGSLREALSTAGPGDVVSVPAGTYVLSSGALTVPAGVTVDGAGARTTTVSGGGVSGVFRTGGAGVVLEDLTITAGRAPAGGGVYSESGLTFRRVAVVDNVSTGSGGGLYLFGSGALRIEHSLFARNHATGGTGGGVYLFTPSAGSAIVASTIAGNTSSGDGGGLYVLNAPTLFDGATLSGNTATGARRGGNVAVSAATLTMRNTVLAAGSAATGANCALIAGATVASLGHNAQDIDPVPDAGCQSGLSDPTDRARLVLQLGPLQDNGGPTDTMLPAAGSPLVNTGDTANCTATDQRGVARPQGGACDVGAVERAAPLVGSAFADGITTTTATLHASLDTVGLGGSVRFAYGPTSGYGAFTAALALPALAGEREVTAQLTGLQPGTTYHFQVLLTSPEGTAAGADQTFTTAVPGTPGPLPSQVRCRVPRLKGRTLRAARRALARAGCKLGSVRRPRARRGARGRRGLVVRRQSRRAGARLPAGTRVGVTLGPKPPRRAPSRRGR